MDSTPAEECRKRVREADILVGIVGLHYGSTPPDEETSFTELEYDEAIASRRHRLMFVTPDDFLVQGDQRESETKWERQKAFRKRVLEDRVAASFDNPDQLALEIVLALGEKASQGAESAFPAVAPRNSQLMFAALADQNRKLADTWSQEVNEKLEGIRERYREGRYVTALSDLRTLKAHRSWGELDPKVQAKVLRTLSVYELQAGGDRLALAARAGS